MVSAWYDLVVMETRELGDQREVAFAWGGGAEWRRKERRLHACGLMREHGAPVCAGAGA